jgi:hypothetical protein
LIDNLPTLYNHIRIMNSLINHTILALRISIGIIITSVLAILALIYNTDPYKEDWFISFFYFLVYMLISGISISAFILWNNIYKQQNIFKETLHSFVLTTSFIASLIVFVLILWQSSYLSLTSITIVGIVAICYGVLRYIE